MYNYVAILTVNFFFRLCYFKRQEIEFCSLSGVSA
jgi:hypothetical protein